MLDDFIAGAVHVEAMCEMSAIFHVPPDANKIAYASWERHRERNLLDRGIGVTGIDRGSRRLGLSNSSRDSLSACAVALRQRSESRMPDSCGREYFGQERVSYPRIKGTQGFLLRS
jgi:hypothetical protein